VGTADSVGRIVVLHDPADAEKELDTARDTSGGGKFRIPGWTAMNAEI
jgi:hypothetical protein